MPLQGDFAALKKLRRQLEDLAKPEGKGQNAIGNSVGKEVRGVLRSEFATGEGPEGSWTPTKQGRQPLESKKLAGAWGFRFDRGVLRFVAKTKRNLLEALHAGHTWPARQAAVSRFYDIKGKLIKLGALSGAKIKRYKFVEEKVSRHTVGQRVLPARPMYPDGALPPTWVDAVKRGALTVLERLGA